jgi:gamma-glutamyltranspeptidase / glutathione hydrolase
MKSVVIAAPSEYSASAGAAIADDGGSVVDALIAATLTAMCSEPGVCAPGGGGFLTVWPAGEDPISIDGYMAMPGRDCLPTVL